MASEIVGLHIGPSEAEPFWTSFLCDLMRRGLTGVKLVADRLAKIHLCMAGRMRQRHEGLAPSGKGTRLANGRLFTPVAPPSRRRSIS